MVRFSLILLLFFVTPALSGCGSEDNKNHGLSVHDIEVVTQAGKSHPFEVELALTPQELSVGLMYRKEMDDYNGMLFFFGNERPVRFWMKNTFIPLDMIFIKKDGTIFYIHENAQPHDLTGISPDGEAIAVLELNAGLSDKLNIQKGDKVIHELFGTK